MTDDQTITCVACGGQFAFTAKDQAFFASNAWSRPKRCKECRRDRGPEAERRGSRSVYAFHDYDQRHRRAR